MEVVDNQNVVNGRGFILPHLIDERFGNLLVFQTDGGGIDAVARSAERLSEEVFVPKGGGVGEIRLEQVMVNRVIVVVAAEAAHHGIDVGFRQVVLLEEGVDEGTLFFGVMGIIKIGVDDAAETFGGVGVGEE